MSEHFPRPSAAMLLRDIGAGPRLTVYLAAAPGAGKTYRIIQDARRLLADGLRVAIGWIETKGRPDLEEMVENIPRIPARRVRIGAAEFVDFDYDAAIALSPQVVILDELAHTNADGGRHAKRWEDALALRKAGIGVVGALNVAHLDTVAPIAERLIGFPIREIVPTAFLCQADHVIAIDTSEEELEARLLSGHIVHPDDITRARNGVFRPQTLRMLREMMLRTIDDLTTPPLPAAKTSTALALVTPNSDLQTLVSGAARLASALDMVLEIARIGACDAEDRIESIAAEQGARVVNLASFNASRPSLDGIKAALIVIPSGPLARRLAGKAVDRDVFVMGGQGTEAREYSIASGTYTQAAGDRLRIGYGRLTVYLGAAAGCGKTYAMLDRAHRLRAAGIDVAAAFVETHRRAETESMLVGIEQLPGKTFVSGGVTHIEPDIEAILTRKPAVVLIDELAHTNAPGSAQAKRYEDVLKVLRSGISVLTTLNIQHLEGLNDAVERLTGTRVRETIPDEILRLADEIIFIDIAPEVLRERLRQGKIYPRERVESALANFFRIENLAALREVAVREVIRTRGYLPQITPIGRILLGVKGHEEEGALIERCARLAQRLESDMSVLHITHKSSNAFALSILANIAERVHASWHVSNDADASATLVRFAMTDQATTIAVRGARKHISWPQRATFAQRILDAGARQVLIVAMPEQRPERY